MTIDVTSLEARSAASLRAFVIAQRLRVRRFPDDVEPVTPWGVAIGPPYWRYLLRRVPLEGVCAKYQTYDAYGSENDWNLNIVPDDSYRWMVDAEMLHALSLFADAPTPVDPSEIKHYGGSPAIECELTPDNAVYDTFRRAALPISSGGLWRDQDENEWLGPTNERVGVYGVFAGDYGHGGRPEIHPFDAFWRRYHATGTSGISWDLGVFQDDSNRFNGSWSRPPIDVEFRVPFCLDVPVTMRTGTTRRARFALRRSPRCDVVGGRTMAGSGPSAITETFVAPTVRLDPRARNRLVISVEDVTGVPGQPFSVGLGDLRYTLATRWHWLGTQAWISGSVVVRVGVDQDGFAYWNLFGPHSLTAAEASADDDTTVPDEAENKAELVRPAPRPSSSSVRHIEARVAVPDGDEAQLAVDLVVEQTRHDGTSSLRVVTIRPRERVVVRNDDDPQYSFEVESFDLFATAVGRDGDGSRARTVRTMDVAAAIGRLAGLDRRGRRLTAVPATIEIDDTVSVELATRYAPYRNGRVRGEEQSLVSSTLDEHATGPIEVHCGVRLTRLDGSVAHLNSADAGRARTDDTVRVAIDEMEGNRRRLVVGPFHDQPVSLQIAASFADGYGLTARAVALVDNYRMITARSWIETAAQLSVNDLCRRRQQIEAADADAPTAPVLAADGLLDCLISVLESIDDRTPLPAKRVAGAVRLAARVSELLPAIELATVRTTRLGRGRRGG